MPTFYTAMLIALCTATTIQAADVASAPANPIAQSAPKRQRPPIDMHRTSRLRNLFLTAPYLHDGSHPTLWHVVDHATMRGSLVVLS